MVGSAPCSFIHNLPPCALVGDAYCRTLRRRESRTDSFRPNAASYRCRRLTEGAGARSVRSMCGIAGFIDCRRVHIAEHWTHTVAAMATPLRHRGPDDAGAWTDPSAGVALAHRRLSMLVVQPTGH